MKLAEHGNRSFLTILNDKRMIDTVPPLNKKALMQMHSLEVVEVDLVDSKILEERLVVVVEQDVDLVQLEIYSNRSLEVHLVRVGIIHFQLGEEHDLPVETISKLV
jgi:hypothetical protein